MNNKTKLLFTHKFLYDVYFYGAIIIPFFVSKGYGVSAAFTFASASIIISMIMEVPTGIIGDRYGHKMSVLLGAFLTGFSLIAFLLFNNIVWDGAWLFIFAISGALASGSDVALLRYVSNNFERDNRTFEYLKSVMLLLSFGAAGFIVKYLSINTAIALSGGLAIASLIPLLMIKTDDKKEAANIMKTSIVQQIADLPLAIRKVRGGLSLIIFAGLIGAVTFSAKEIISSLNSVYNVDITFIGIIAAFAMAGRIIGTLLEKRLLIAHKTLFVALTIVVCATSLIELNRVLGIFLILISTVIAQMLFYRLKYQLASEAPQTHIASLVSGVTLAGKLFSGGIILTTGVFTGFNAFYLSFVAVGITLAIFGSFLTAKISK